MVVKFHISITQESEAEMVVEAPSREAVEKFIAADRADGFSSWFLEPVYAYGVEITDASYLDADATIGADGKEQVPS